MTATRTALTAMATAMATRTTAMIVMMMNVVTTWPGATWATHWAAAGFLRLLLRRLLFARYWTPATYRECWMYGLELTGQKRCLTSLKVLVIPIHELAYSYFYVDMIPTTNNITLNHSIHSRVELILERLASQSFYGVNWSVELVCESLTSFDCRPMLWIAEP